ncbi:MAG TPA: DUF3455 domain-containing protein [Burkholderiaceae bacterium]|nr:DUF3455 domain-containing protein [Burkholderiaceae bacterium]
MRAATMASFVALLPIALSLARAAEPVPDSLAPPAGLKRVLEASATGVQIYRCGPPKSAEGAPAAVWNFEAPRATLTDQRGEGVARHFAGPSWEATDGSTITGKVTAKADAKEAGAIAWLLLKTESAGKPGRFDQVRAVQRLFTSGGSAPQGACSKVGEVLEVPYRAMYVFWAQ